MYVFDFVCFIPSKSQTMMVTCGYSISVPDTHMLWDTTLHLGVYTGFFKGGFQREGMRVTCSVCVCAWCVQAPCT